MIQAFRTMSIPVLGDSRCLARWQWGLVESAVIHDSSYLLSKKFDWVVGKPCHSRAEVGQPLKVLDSRKSLTFAESIKVYFWIKVWKCESIRMTPPRGLLAIKPQGWRIAFGKIETACFISFRGFVFKYIWHFIFKRCWTREHVLFLHQTTEDLTPPGVYFQKFSGRGGGCVEEGSVGRLLPLVCS